MDIFLIIVCTIVFIMLTGINFYLLALYCHPDDKGFGASLFCKILVIFGFTLSWAQVLLIPVDVSINQDIYISDISISTVYYIIYLSILGLVVGLIPFCSFFYETDEDHPFVKRLMDAMCYESITVIVIGVIFVVTYSIIGYANLPIQTVTRTFSSSDNGKNYITEQYSLLNQENSSTFINIPVSFPIFAMAGMSFVGWWGLCLFGGVGLSALPLDMINSFIGMPKPITSKEAASKKIELRDKSKQLIAIGATLKDSEQEASLANGFWARRKAVKLVNKEYSAWKAAVLYLDNQYEIFELELKYMDMNPLGFYLELVLGCIFAIVSICWWIQMLQNKIIIINTNNRLIYMVLENSKGFPLSPFLNWVFLYFEQSTFSFAGVFLLGFFCIYLLMCCQKGNLKFGLRIPFIFSVHPMKVNETWMNSFLFNVNLILVCSVSVTFFSCRAFSMYTRNADINLIFLGQVQFLMFFNWFFEYHIFEYVLLSFSFLSAVFLILAPAQKPQIIKNLEVKQAETQEIELKTKS